MNKIMSIPDVLDQITNARVLCVGDVMLDRFIQGEVSRISPEAPIPVLNVRNETAMVGGAGNVVRNLAALGASATLVAAVGDDAAGGQIAALLDGEKGVTSNLVKSPDRQTTIKTRFSAAGQQLLRADREVTGDLAVALQEQVKAMATAAMSGVNAVVLSDYGKGVLSDMVIQTLIAAARAAGCPVIVDPKGADYRCYRDATILTPNQYELAQASGRPTNSDAAVADAARVILDSCGVELVLATRSQHGMSLISETETSHFPAQAKEVFDVSGAGDTVVAALSAALAVGAPMEFAVRFANIAAGVVVKKAGTAVSSRGEILSALHEEAFLTGETKVVPEYGAGERVAAWREQGLKVGFTNGCFDLLHPGHLSGLNQARAACDKLVVGLNSDTSVARLKGAGRPIQTESSRAAVLAALACVDLVVVFSDDTPLRLINLLKPDILVKGADYTESEVVGAKEVQSWGGRVVLADLVEGFSTTATVKKISK